MWLMYELKRKRNISYDVYLFIKRNDIIGLVKVGYVRMFKRTKTYLIYKRLIMDN